MEKSVRIAASALDAIVAHAQRDAPNECCGLLVGRVGEIDEAVATTNECASATRYRVTPSEHFDLIRKLRGTERSIVGAYHSHPHSSAIPSATDIAEAVSSDFLYVIVSLGDAEKPNAKCYRIRGGAVEEIDLSAG